MCANHFHSLFPSALFNIAMVLILISDNHVTGP